MPVKVVKNLPAIDILRKENIFVMDSERAKTQQIRVLKLLIVNLMPRKEVTETQLLRLLSNTPIQIDVDFIYTTSHEVKNTQQSYLDSFYTSFERVKANFYDGMIITGAPIETLDFEAVDYWEEFLEIIDWSRSHVYSTLHICWGAQAGLYARHGVGKQPLAEKLVGVYESSVENPTSPLFRGFDDSFYCPCSRYTASNDAEMEQLEGFEVLSRLEAGINILGTENLREVYIFGHLEYDRDTLNWEYQRDKKAGLSPELPVNYFPADDDSKEPKMTWSSSASLFFSNWLNHAVYQGTPYVLERLSAHPDEKNYDFNKTEYDNIGEGL